PRPKTGIARRCKLWAETVEAIRAAIAARPVPKTGADAGCVFLTLRGERLTRMRPRPDDPKTRKPRPATQADTVARELATLLQEQRPERPGIGYYALRHCFETVAGEGRDQVAVDLVMGHADESIAGNYRERISDDRLRAVVNVVRAWLWPTAAPDQTTDAPA